MKMYHLGNLPVIIIGNAFEAILECALPEIHQQSQGEIEKPQVGQNLLWMNDRNPLSGFQFKQQLSFDNNISPKRFLKLLPLVHDRNAHLSSNPQAPILQIFGK